MRSRSRKMSRKLLTGLLILLAYPAFGDTVGTDIYPLHRTLFWVCLSVGIVLSVLLMHAMLKYRKSANGRANNASDNSLVELFWLSIPCFLLIALAVPATLFLMHLDNKAQNVSNPAVTDYFLK